MALTRLQDYTQLVPTLAGTPNGFLWSSFDKEADVLYVNFEKPSHATDSELTEDDVIVRYSGKKVVGVTILHASKFLNKKNGKIPLSRFRKSTSRERKKALLRYKEMKKGKSVAVHPIK